MFIRYTATYGLIKSMGFKFIMMSKCFDFVSEFKGATCIIGEEIQM